MPQAFQKVPILDWKLIKDGHKDVFIAQLREALVNVGFLYLLHPPVDPELVARIKEYAPRMFELPLEKKVALRMSNSPHFLGYSSLGSELTKGVVDQREQFDFGSPVECRWKPGDSDYLKLWGPPQGTYLAQVEQLSEVFTELISESLGLGPHGLDIFFDTPKSSMQHRSKSSDSQGVGPHYDSGFLTLLLQASPHKGLQAQNPEGRWIDVPPINDTLVVNLGKGFEMVTKRIAIATSHQVRSPVEGEAHGARYSIPFFQTIKQQVKLSEVSLEFPREIVALRESRGADIRTDSVNYAEYGEEPAGHVALIGRVKSHPDVAERHYPELFGRYFPQGIPQSFAK